MDEIWKEIPGFEGHYEVSSKGAVRSLNRRNAYGRNRRGKLLKLTTHPQGYKRVTLCKDGIHFERRVHVLMLEAFVGPRPTNYDACHTNDIPDDNRLENLRWDSKSQNRLDSVRNGTHAVSFRPQIGQKHYKAKVSDADVLRIREALLFGADRKDISSTHGISLNSVHQIATRRSWRHL